MVATIKRRTVVINTANDEPLLPSAGIAGPGIAGSAFLAVALIVARGAKRAQVAHHHSQVRMRLPRQDMIDPGLTRAAYIPLTNDAAIMIPLEHQTAQCAPRI